MTTENGITWTDAEIVKSIDADNVWVFWEAKLVPVRAGSLVIHARATDINGTAQPPADSNSLDGFNVWLYVSIDGVD